MLFYKKIIGEYSIYYEKNAKGELKKMDVPYDIPKGWVLSNLGFIGRWVSGTTPKKSNKEYYKNATIPWLKTGDLNNTYILEIPEKITELALKETSVKLIPSNSIVIAMYGATIGKVGITTFETTTNQACCSCINLYKIDTLFLFYFLLSYKKNFLEFAFGAAQPNISKEKIIATPFAIPPLKEQNRIVNKIDSIFEQLEFLKN